MGGSPISLGIVGSGAMGRGLAEVAVTRGLQVTLCKATPGECGEAQRAIEKALRRAVDKGRLDAAGCDAALGRLRCVDDRDALGDAALVIETVVEDLEIKRALFADLEARLGAGVVLASNTSSIPLSSLASALRDPSRFVGMHFFSPVPLMKLVEIAAPEGTSDATLELAERVAAELDKTSVLVRDTAGFVVNRLLVPFLLDAIRALEAEVASALSIDLAMRLGCSHPVGPLLLADLIGLDIVLAMSKTLARELDEHRYATPSLLERLVSLGRLGKKTGRGLYDHSTTPPSPTPLTS